MIRSFHFERKGLALITKRARGFSLALTLSFSTACTAKTDSDVVVEPVKSGKSTDAPNKKEPKLPQNVVSISFVPPAEKSLFNDWADVESKLKQQSGYSKSILLVTQGEAPFTFLNLGIWSSAEDIERVLATKDLGTKLKTVETAWYRPLEQLGEMADSVSSDNLFVLPLHVADDKIKVFLDRFSEHREFFSKMPGFSSVGLFSKIGGTSNYNYVVIARWDSKADLKAAIQGRSPDNIFREFPEAMTNAGLYYQTTE